MEITTYLTQIFLLLIDFHKYESEREGDNIWPFDFND